MLQNPLDTADLVTFTEEIVNGKLHFLCSDCFWLWFKNISQERWVCNKSMKGAEANALNVSHLNVVNTTWGVYTMESFRKKETQPRPQITFKKLFFAFLL